MTYNLTQNIYGEKYLYEVNGARFELNSSKSQYEGLLHGIEVDSRKVNLFVGLDSGLLLNYLEQIGCSKDSCYFVEKEEVLSYLKKKIGNIESYKVFKFNIFESLGSETKIINALLSGKLVLYKSYSVIDGYDVDYQLIYQTIHDYIRKLNYHLDTSSRGQVDFFKRNIQNSPDLFNSANILVPTFKEKDILIVGAGPSLIDKIDWIKENKNKVIIIAVTRSAKILFDNNISPDYFIAIDHQEVCLTVSFSALDLFQNTPLIVASYVNPKLLGNWIGDVYYLGEKLPWKSKLNKKNIFAQGPTVTQAAIYFLLQTSAKRVFLTGVDLCFGIEGLKAHAGKVNSIKNINTEKSLYTVFTYNGEKAKTNLEMIYAIEKTEEMLSFYNKENIYNLSTNAAVVKGVRYLDVSEIDGLESGITKNFELYNTSYEEKMTYFKDLKRELEEKKEKLLLSLKIIQKNLTQINSFSVSADVATNFDFKKLTSLELDLEKICGTEFYEFMMQFGVGELLDIPYSSQENLNDILYLIDYQKDFHLAWKRTIDSLIEVIRQALNKVDIRRFELNCGISEDILKFWKENSEYKRIEALTEINAEVSDCKTYFAKEYELLKKSIYKKYRDRVAKRNIKIEIINYTKILFERKDAVGLKSILGATFDVDGLDSPSQESAFKMLLRGFISEIEASEIYALEQYQDVISVEPVDKDISKMALERIYILSVNRKNYLQAIQAYECLCLLEPSMYRLFAEFLLSIGSFNDALDRFADHHQKNPEDIGVLYRMAEVYSQYGYHKESEDLLLVINENYPDFLYGLNDSSN